MNNLCATLAGELTEYRRQMRSALAQINKALLHEADPSNLREAAACADKALVTLHAIRVIKAALTLHGDTDESRQMATDKLREHWRGATSPGQDAAYTVVLCRISQLRPLQ